MKYKLNHNILIPSAETSQRPQVRTRLSPEEKENACELKKIPNQTFHKDREKPFEVFVSSDDGKLELERIRKKNREEIETTNGVKFSVSSGRALDGSLGHVWVPKPLRKEVYRRQELIAQIMRGLDGLPADLQATVALEAGMGPLEARCLSGLGFRLRPLLVRQSLGTLEKLAGEVHWAATALTEGSPGPVGLRCVQRTA